MALDKLTLLDETIINTTATTVATNVVNNSAQTNYISFPVATSNPLTNGWRVYSDGASNSPVDGTGGSPNSTLTQNTSSPLNSTGDFRLTKSSGASRQGEGISTDFTIASRHLGKLLQISFDYEIIGATSLTTDDLRVYIVQNPSGTPIVIEPVNVGIQGTVTGVRLRHIATFQTDISITSYRLCIHIKTTTNSAQTIDFNNFRVWEPTQSIGSIITDWQSYTPSITQGMGGIANSSLRWRRVGASIEIKGNFRAVSPTGDQVRLGLPIGLVANITTTASDDPELCGHFIFDATGRQTGGILHTKNGFNYLNFGRTRTDIDLNPFAIATGSEVLGSNIDLSVFASVPIQGWGSSVAMSSDSNEGRVVAARYTNPSGGLISGGNGYLTWSTLEYDTHSAFNTATGFYTAPISGIYRFSASMRLVTGAQLSSRINGLFKEVIYDEISGGNTSSVTTQVRLNAGETFSFYTGAGGLNSPLTNQSFSVERISTGSQVMAQVETVACRYVSTSGQTIGTDTVVTFATRVTDTHGAYNTTTGIFTAPMSGWYNVGANLVLNTNTLTFIEIQQNSTTRLTYQSFPSNRGIATTSVYLLSGETLRIRASANTSTSLSTVSGDNSINFYRVGV